MNYSKSYTKPKFIYIITQDSTPGWVKIGMSQSPGKRLSDFKVGSARKDFNLEYERPTNLAARIEKNFKNNYSHRRGEWFYCSKEEAIERIDMYITTFNNKSND